MKKRAAPGEVPSGPWEVVFTRRAVGDAKKLAKSGLKEKALVLLPAIAVDPVSSPPPFEKLVGDLSGALSRRINIQHRLVCEVFTELRMVRVLRVWTHFE